MTKTAATKPLTGRKVLCIALGAFGTIIAANMTLAVAAVGSFPGLEVKNGYIASQTFEAERAAQTRLGWTASARHVDGQLRIDVLDAAGKALRLDALTARVGRPTGRAVDMTDRLVQEAGGYAIPAALEPGLWRIDLLATKGDDRFRQHLTVRIAGVVADVDAGVVAK